MKKYTRIILLLVLPFAFACKKETKSSYIYEVEPVSVKKDGGNKQNQKTTTEFISIAYSDIFGSTITNTKLVNLSLAYDAFGDKKFIEDLIIRNYLSTP